MSLASEHYDLDLGDGHWLTFTWWRPDIALNPQYKDFPNEKKIGAIITHEMPNGTMCEGSMWFDCEEARRFFGHHQHRWAVTGLYQQKAGNSDELLTMYDKMTCSPSFLCHCGDHGFIREGKWVRA